MDGSARLSRIYGACRRPLLPQTARLAAAGFRALAVPGCSTNPRVSLPKNIPSSDPRVIVHVLNRTGYGPRPGDVVRVASTGIDRHIDEQLHPELIPDTAAEEQ